MAALPLLPAQASSLVLPRARQAGAGSPSASQTERADWVDLQLAAPEAQAVLQHSYATLLAHRVGSQAAASMVPGPASQLLFHGTSCLFDKLEPRPSQRTDGKGNVDWSGTAIFAAMDPRVALQYTANRLPGYTTGVSLRSYCGPEAPLEISLIGGKSLEDALDHIYGDPKIPESCQGYVHLLDRSRCSHEQGLGCMERLTRDSTADLGQIVVDRRAALADFQAQGLMTLQWRPAF